MALTGDPKTIAFLKDWARFGHFSKGIAAGSLAWKPGPIPGDVGQIKLGIGMPRYPNGAGGNPLSPTDGDKQGAKETDDKAGQLIATQKQILVNNGFINDEINTAIEWLNQDS